MAKFKIGSNVRYNGIILSIRHLFHNMMTVEDIIPPGLPIGNGEINASGEDIYIVKLGNTRYHFLERELTQA